MELAQGQQKTGAHLGFESMSRSLSLKPVPLTNKICRLVRERKNDGFLDAVIDGYVQVGKIIGPH